MTREEQRLANQQAETRQRIQKLQARLRHSEARQRAINRRKYLARCRVVAGLVETAGLLWCPDDVLTKVLMMATKHLTASGAWAGTLPGMRNGAGGSLRRGLASGSPLAHTPANRGDGDGEFAPLEDEEENPRTFDRSD